MDLESQLANALIESHPADAARAFETLPPQEVCGLLEAVGTEVAVAALQHVVPPAAAAVLVELSAQRASALLERLPVEFAGRCLRAVEPARREPLLAALPARRARALRSLLRFAPLTAGALMDPDVLALPADITVREAIARVRESAVDAHYNVYVLDQGHRLVGVLNLRELLLARPAGRLSSVMRTPVHSIAADVDRHTLVSDPGWRHVHALPVVDEDGGYLGAVRYRALRRAEEELRAARPEQGATAQALGTLLRAGAAGVLEAVAAGAADAPSAGRS